MAPAARPLRADAARNRTRVLDAARAVFAERGIGASVDEVARVAGVGVGTLYRRFPTKDALLEAIIEERNASLAAELEEVAAIDDPWRAFEAAARTIARRIAEDRGFFEVVQEGALKLPGAQASRRRVLEMLEPIVTRAQEAGVLRSDVTTLDVPVLCVVAARLPRWRLAEAPGLWERYLGVCLDGLRPESAHPLPHPPPDPG